MESWDGTAKVLNGEYGEFGETLGFSLPSGSDFANIFESAGQQIIDKAQQSVVKSVSSTVDKALGVQQPPIQNLPQSQVVYYQQAPQPQPSFIPNQMIPSQGIPKPVLYSLIGLGSLLALGLTVKMIRG